MLNKSCTVLVTAIGSLSGDCVISTLNELDCNVVGCDIHPSEWHASSKECGKVYKVPSTKNEKEYIESLIYISKENDVKYLFPLTDSEIDVINRYRMLFSQNNIVLCIVDESTLSIVRNKYLLYKTFEQDRIVPCIKTYRCKEDHLTNICFPCIAKPINGRSSEGVRFINNMSELEWVMKLDDYVIQQYIDGHIFTVDYVRSQTTGNDYSMPREELLRTKNGAGITVRITKENRLMDIVSYIGEKLDINGCINLEFINSNGTYYLMDINPRFSAGVAFSKMAGYNMVESHLNCFMQKDILFSVPFKEQIMTKRYKEEILS